LIGVGSQKFDLGDLFDQFQGEHDWRKIGGVTVKFKSGVPFYEKPHLTINGSGSGYFPIPEQCLDA
jgi:hypothetical protein